MLGYKKNVLPRYYNDINKTNFKIRFNNKTLDIFIVVLVIMIIGIVINFYNIINIKSKN